MLLTRYIGVLQKNGRNTFQRSIRFNSTKGDQPLNWVEYLNLKKQNNRINTAASVVTGLCGVAATLAYLGNIEIDVEKPIMGFDPFMVLGGGVFLGGGVGYMLGPFLGTSIFQLINRSTIKQFHLKDKIFLQKIKANRVNPSSQSFSNPVPDFYGERIYSLKGYKQWLRDCNAYRRKAKEFL